MNESAAREESVPVAVQLLRTACVTLDNDSAAAKRDIGRALARGLHRPYWLPAPAWALRLGLGRAAADSLILSDVDATPRALLDSGFAFRHQTAGDAVNSALR